jgi:hypothetical protein
MNTYMSNRRPFETGPWFGQRESEYGAALNVLSPSELKAVKITSKFETNREGGFGGLTGNMDGQGLSFGLMNFTIKAGSLIPLLQEFINKYPERYARAFGADAETFKGIVFATKPDPKNPKRRVRDVERQMEFVNTRMNAVPRRARGNKIVEPWKTYFGRLEVDPEFQKIQVKAVRVAVKRARYWCDYFTLKTERGFVFMFDMVSSHGGAWLNADKFKGRRIELLRKMLAAKKAQLGRDTLTELEKLEVIANMIADALSENEFREMARVRKLWFVRGIGKVHGHLYDLAKDFGVTDRPPDFGSSAAPSGEFADYPRSRFAWPGPREFEAPRPRIRQVGTDCGRPGMPAATLSQPGGRCTGATPPVCPPVSGILSQQSVSNIPFEYVDKVGRDATTHLTVVTRRLRPRTQRFLPVVRTALTEFVANMNRFGLPVEAILTAGSFCCRCISRTNRLSNHSHGDAFDLVGLRWAAAGGRETIVHNWNTAQRAVLRRINACLRLSFATVIDYHNTDHRDHFHCDMNHGAVPSLTQPTTMRFTQEALSVVLGRAIPITGKLDAVTRRALIEFAGGQADAIATSAKLKQVLMALFTRIASGSSAAPTASELSFEVRPSRSRSIPAVTPAPPGLTLEENRWPIAGGRFADMKTGIFVPLGYKAGPEVDLIFYFHGHKIPSGMGATDTISKYWSRPLPYLLREGLNDSNKNAILVAPTLGALSQPGRLIEPGNFDLFVDHVLRLLVEKGPYKGAGSPPRVGNIILSCHSGGGVAMRTLVGMTHRYSDKIRECWGFDCLYGDIRVPNAWRTWARSHPAAKLYVYFLCSTATNSKHLQGTGDPAIAPPANVTVEFSRAPSHSRVPITHWPDLLQKAPFLQNRWVHRSH